MKKKLISLFIAAVIAVSAAVPSLHAAAADINYGEYITNPIETTVIIEGLQIRSDCRFPRFNNFLGYLELLLCGIADKIQSVCGTSSFGVQPDL